MSGPGARVLDVGCGGGFVSQALSDAGYEMVGVDPSARAVRAARLATAGRFAVALTSVPPNGSNPWDGSSSGRPELEAAWPMLQHLYGMYIAADDEEANQALAAFIEVWQDTGLDEFDKLGVLKRVAHGFVNTTNFAARALLLTPAMPT